MNQTRLARNLTAWVALSLMYLPLVAVAVLSFNQARFGTAWHGFTLDWYRQLLANETIHEAAWNTLILAVGSTAVATVLGTLFGVGLMRFPWPAPLRNSLEVILNVPVVAPDLVFAAALLCAFRVFRMVSDIFDPGLFTMLLGHVTFQVAFVALVVKSRLAMLDVALFEAARDLYADGFYLFRKVTLPLITPAIGAGALLAFTLSLDDFVISFFTSSPSSTTLPVFIYASVRRGVTPEIHALSTLMVVGTFVLVMALNALNRPPPEST